MGKAPHSADQITLRRSVVGIIHPIVELVGVVRGELGIPGMPDYYYLLADLVGQDPVKAVPEMVGLMVARDYAGLARLFGIGSPASLVDG